MTRFLLYMIALIIPFTGTAQQWYSTKHGNSDSYIRMTYENDVFTGTDKYYTQGIFATVVSPSFKRFPIYKLALQPAGTHVQYGFSLQHYAYTPASITDTMLRKNDWPYGAALLLHADAAANNANNTYRLTTTFTLGIIGPAAGGAWIQKTIHQYTGDAEPQGWQYQLSNDLAINYAIAYEHNLLKAGSVLALNGGGIIAAGTFNTSVGIHTELMLGYFKLWEQNNKGLYGYIYTQPQATLVCYNAMLQGGLLSNSIHTLPASAINRLMFQNRIGAVAGYGKLQLAYYTCIATPAFRGAARHNWGGLSIMFAF